MPAESEPKTAKVRGQIAKAHSASANPELVTVIEQTAKLWRKHHLTYDQTKCVVEQTRKALQLSTPKTRRRTVSANLHSLGLPKVMFLPSVCSP
jgi:integrase/recombinase XerD